MSDEPKTVGDFKRQNFLKTNSFATEAERALASKQYDPVTDAVCSSMLAVAYELYQIRLTNLNVDIRR